MENQLVFTNKIRVYYEDTDFSSNVYHAKYLHYFERSRTEMLRSFGINQKNLSYNDEKIGFVVHKFNVTFKSPAQMDDLLLIETRVKRFKRISIDMEQKIYKLEDQHSFEQNDDNKNQKLILLTIADVQLAMINDKNKLIQIPSFLSEKLTKL